MADATDSRPLAPLPPQPDGVPWPTDEWPGGDPPHGVDVEGRLDELFADGPLATTLAAVVIHRGRLVAERYRTDADVSETTNLISWSMAKSIGHAATGILVRDGRLSLDDRPNVPEWGGDDDPRRAITFDHLLEMRDGLAFVEDYVDADISDALNMLFGKGTDDVAAFAADRELAHPPGTWFNYSSGTSNILSRAIGAIVGGGRDGMEAFLRGELFDVIGMRSADPWFDQAGTFIASSYVYATARDFARFGYLYLRDGVWDGRRILPEGWVDHARRMRSQDDETGNYYGAQWWVVGDEAGTFWANGYEGQSILVCPVADLVVVRLGKTPSERYPELKQWRADIVDAFLRA